MSDSSNELHYEVVVIINPEFTDQVPAMIDGYRTTVESKNGKLTRLEDWGCRNLAYPINKLVIGHYVLMNITCDDHSPIEELQEFLDKDDPVVRCLVTRTRVEESDPSPMMAKKEAVTEAAE